MEERVKEADSRLAASQLAADKLRSELAVASGLLHSAQERAAVAEAQLEEVHALVSAVQAEHDEALQQCAALRAELQAANAAHEAQPAQAARLDTDAAVMRISRLEAAQSRLLAEIDAQAVEIERLFSELSSAQAEQAAGTVQTAELTAQNARLRELVLEQAELPTPRKSDDTQVATLRAERDAMQTAVSAAVRREEALERQLAEVRMELARAHISSAGAPAAALPAILASIETRLLKLQTG
jgi:chromosome segregation ATPase